MNDEVTSIPDIPDIIPRLPNESALAFEAFCVYAQMGPERSIVAVGQKLGKSRVLIERWSSRHAWVRRVKQFDTAVAQVSQASYLAAATALAKANAEEASAMRTRALARLQSVPLDAISPAVALKIWEACVRIGRLSLGMPTDATQASVQQQSTINANVSMHDDSDAEMVQLMVHNRQARDLARQLFDSLMTGDDGDGDMDADMDGDNPSDTDITDDTLDCDMEADE